MSTFEGAARGLQLLQHGRPDWQRYGLSAYFAEDEDAVADLASDQLERFPLLGCTIPPSSPRRGSTWCRRSPRVTIAFVDLDAGIAAIETVEHETRPNPYHEA